MRLLLDANLSPRLATSLSAAGYDVVHVGDLDLLAAPDSVIFDRAVADPGQALAVIVHCRMVGSLT